MVWTDEDDLILAELVLKSLRETGSEDRGFSIAYIKLVSSPEECAERWTGYLMHMYQAARQVALAQYKKRKPQQKPKVINKDWNYYQQSFLEEAISEAREYIWRASECDSPIEKIVMLYLFNLYKLFPIGIIKIHPQVIIGKYTADFLVTYELSNNYEIRIVIECDGHEFHEKTKEQVARDKERDRFMTKEGYKILRYSGSEICEDPMRIVMDIQHILYNARG